MPYRFWGLLGFPPRSEGGFKTELFSGRLRTTVAYFDLTKTNISTSDPAHPGFSIGAAEVHSRGPEVDIQGEILPGWNVIATYANLTAHYAKDTFLSGRAYNTPRNTGSFWSTYEFLGGDVQGLKFGGGVNLQDGQEACCDEPNRYKLAGFATVNLLASYTRKVKGAQVSLQLNVNNLLDKHYYTGISTYRDFSGMAWADFGQPRTFMGMINIQY